MHQALATPSTAPAKGKKRWSRRKRYIIFGSIGAVLLWIIVSIILSKREKPISVTTEKAFRKTILQTVSATGKVQPETEVKISPEVAGEIIELPIADGMTVKKGDLHEAMRIQTIINPLKEAVYGAGEPTGEAHARMKTAMKCAGVIEHDFVRAPTHRPSAEEEAEIRRAVSAAGLGR